MHFLLNGLPYFTIAKTCIISLLTTAINAGVVAYSKVKVYLKGVEFQKNNLSQYFRTSHLG
ncbi:hypothetical protein ULMS_09340 [Patiriisocius marinistellae]|uniref:Uncharacterized protein n=1 Tax=Patiriisocius marinistellae TaxID=2494560 RepID=A0A5J4FZ32_9FLAO|nr:hypothetical protein ULMS_09340 [Patiriisocius marinistellae]